MENKKIVAIIQARMGSTRLHGKVMKKILGKEVILHDIDRIKQIKNLDKIVIATTTKKDDDIIVETIKNYNSGIGIFRGSEDDVLDRYYKAAKEFNATVIVRITSDCPLIDPLVSDKVIETFLNNKCDYCSNCLKRTYPQGLDTEVFSFEALEKAWKEAKEDYQREHVTPYIYEHPEKFKLLNVLNDKDLSHLRWTLDTIEDFNFIDEIYKRLYKENKSFYIEDILKVLEKEPKMLEINKDIKQKLK
ncbi:MAG: acylneuraminate cytidylyltransferase [Candidatus Altiarchaeales archaeon HGW-Altiarchaeales-1]|nr:MAG: acylneuraminate cytidylyltransferase [Candidatus Altiarchaeales archaeon HGW-Altiarchaeales-1]